LCDTAPKELVCLAVEWAALDAAAPDAALLRRTRRLTDLRMIARGLCTATALRRHGDGRLALAFERIALVQLETVKLREQSGSGELTLHAIAQSLDDAIAAGLALPAVRTLFETLRRRLGGGGAASGQAARVRDDAELERLVGRIQALRAKTVARGCTEQEALAAAEKVAELLDRYGLTLGELEVRDQPCDGIGIQTDRRRSVPMDSCVPAIAKFFDCRVWVEQPSGMPLRHIFFGMRADVTAARYLYELVEQAFETETDAFRRGATYARLAGQRRTATNSFQIGLARGIRDKLAALRAARAASRSASGRDLVPVKAAVVEQELAKLGLYLRSGGSSAGSRILPDAFREGQAAGARFEFAPAIGRTV
jgi:hypothetical protein